MTKRLAAGLLLTLGLMVTAFGFLVGPASAQTVSPYNSTTTVPASTTSSTDPCLIGNGTTGTTNGNCLPTTPQATTPAAINTAAALDSPTTASSSGLAFTGTDVIGSVIVAFLLIGGGIVVVRFSRKRPTT